jgi:hypothetical protein
MKHLVTDLDDTNELVMFSKSLLGNFYFDTFFDELDAEFYPIINSYMQYELLPFTQVAEPHYILVDANSTNCNIELTNSTLWSLYFESSRNKDGVVARCLLIDPHGNPMRLSFHLESKCSNYVAEYEALVQGLRKSIDMNVECLEVVGDSQAVIKQ